MESIKYTVTYEELKSQVTDLIAQHKSFSVIECRWHMHDAVKLIENAIKSNKLRCRTYMNMRSIYSVIGLAAAPTGLAIFPIINLTHDLLTAFPDYEICKHPIDCTLDVRYCKAGNIVENTVEQVKSNIGLN